MLASFNYPIESVEIRPYVSAVLKELGLEELNKEAALRGKIYYHLIEILNNNTIRKNLDSLYKLSLKNDHDSGLLNFYLLHHAWDELEEIGANFYFEEADLTNIETVLKNEARKWIEQYDKQ